MGFVTAEVTAASALDQTFGRRGLVITPFVEGVNESFTGVRRLRDGSLVAAGATSFLHFARWSPTGRVRVRRTVTRGALGALRPTALVERPDGVIVAAGTTTDLPGRRAETTVGVGALTASGDPHPAFGTDGLAPRFDFPGSESAQARAVMVTANNGVVVGGYAVVNGRPQFALARLDARGELDPTFGSGGTITTPIPRGGEVRGSSDAPVRTSVNALVAEPSGRFLAVGSAVDGASRRSVVVVVRYLSNGALDGTYGRGGISTVSFHVRQSSLGNVATLQPIRTRAGTRFALVVGGAVGEPSSGPRLGLLRLLDDGRLDRSFGRNGRAVLDVRSLGGITGLALGTAGAVIASGSIEYARPPSGFIVTRLSRHGAVDRSFGGAGVACPTVRRSASPNVSGERNPTSLLPQANGRVLLGGQVEDVGGDVEWVLARFNRRFVTPLDCFSVTPTTGFRGATVRAAIARRGELVVDVRQFSGTRYRRLGRIRFGCRGTGLVALHWNLRVRGVKLRRNGEYSFTPALVDRRGRVIGRTVPAEIFPP
jgi:uncharacterized delta-60 repeat protein